MVEKKINKDFAMLQERNSLLERQLKIVLRNILDKETPFRTKEKRKRNSCSDIVDEFDINRQRSEKGNSIKYFDILKHSEPQEDLGKSRLEIQSNKNKK